MPLYRVTFMNHIVETYEVEAPDDETAWASNPADFEEREPVDNDCTLCEVVEVELAND